MDKHMENRRERGALLAENAFRDYSGKDTYIIDKTHS